MREPLFGGKRIDNGVLVLGHLLYQKSCLGTILDCVIVQDWVQLKEETVINVGYEVIPETVCQYIRRGEGVVKINNEFEELTEKIKAKIKENEDYIKNACWQKTHYQSELDGELKILKWVLKELKQ